MLSRYRYRIRAGWRAQVSRQRSRSENVLQLIRFESILLLDDRPYEASLQQDQQAITSNREDFSSGTFVWSRSPSPCLKSNIAPEMWCLVVLSMVRFDAVRRATFKAASQHVPGAVTLAARNLARQIPETRCNACNSYYDESRDPWGTYPHFRDRLP